MTNRALSFGSVAAAYERHRPGYPDAVIERILEYAQAPVRTALEVGAGTGKATRMVAAREIAVLACEPDRNMLAVLADQTAGLPVTPIVSRFEDLSTPGLAGQVELIFSATAWHWTDPATRWDRAAAILPSLGTVAIFGCALGLADPELLARYDQIIDITDAGPEAGDSWGPWSMDDVAGDPRFTDFEEHRIPRILELSIDDFIDHLSTRSRFLIIDDDERERLFDRLRRELPGTIEFDAGIKLSLARRT